MPTIKQIRAFTYYSENLRNPKPITLGKMLLNAGYSIEQSKRPTDVTKSKGWQELMDEFLPDELLQQKHQEILDAKIIDHMVFPTAMSDAEIKELIDSVGGTVKKIMHGDQANHVWFWSPNSKVRLDAIKLGYQVKGKLTASDRVPEAKGDTYNTFIQQNNLNPNAPEAKKLVTDTVDILMDLTKRKTVENQATTPVDDSVDTQ